MVESFSKTASRTRRDAAPLAAADLLGLAIDAVPAAVLITAVSRGEILAASRACRRLWGAPETVSLAGLKDCMRGLAADPKHIPDLWAQRHELPTAPDGMQSFLLLNDGRQLRWHTVRLSDPDGTLRGEAHTFDDATPRPASPEPQRGSDSLFRLTFEKAAVGMTLISSDYRFLRANPSFCRMLALEERDLLERSLFDLLPPDDSVRREELAEGFASGQDTFHRVQPFARPNGETVWVELSISVVRDAERRPVYFVALAEDITQQKLEKEEQARRTHELQTLAITDPLTGLYNHRFMQEALAQQITEHSRTGQPVSVLMIDVDEFRELNETYGHDAGNRALASVADCVRGALRDRDLPCRYGGDEMVAILVGAPLPAALAAADRIRQRMEEIRPIATLPRPITCSIGVASYPSHASTAASLLKAADVALYEAKREGKNRVCGYVPAPTGDTSHQFESLQSNLHGASLDAVNALVTAIDLRDRYTGAHCQRVGRLSLELAVRLGCSEHDLEILRLGSPLLDVGKIGLPDYLLTKNGPLTRAEWDLMRQHPVWGEELVRRTSLRPEILELVRWHHERLDGSGYPDALTEEQIPLLVRIVAVADVATALREDRPHRRAWPRERVQEYLRRHAGEKLDERVVHAYGDLFGAR